MWKNGAVWRYKGCVKLFDTVIAGTWEGETRAPSEAKARSNLAWRYKLSHGYSADSAIRLPGKLKRVG